MVKIVLPAVRITACRVRGVGRFFLYFDEHGINVNSQAEALAVLRGFYNKMFVEVPEDAPSAFKADVRTFLGMEDEAAAEERGRRLRKKFFQD